MSHPHPEKIRALNYLKRKGSESPIELLRVRIAESFADLEAVIATVPPSLRKQSPGPVLMQFGINVRQT